MLGIEIVNTKIQSEHRMRVKIPACALQFESSVCDHAIRRNAQFVSRLELSSYLNVYFRLVAKR